MTFPVYAQLGGLEIHPHWIFEILAWVVGLSWYLRHRSDDVVDRPTRWRLIAAGAAGGLIGSRILALLEDPIHLAQQTDAARLLAGKTIVGGLIGGWIAVEWLKRRLGVTLATGDALSLPLALGIATGRIGCFLSGLDDSDYGTATTLPWGIDFGDGVLRHPTQLYEIAFLLALALVLTRVHRGSAWNGDRFRLFMLAYMSFRFAVDFAKPATRLGGLSVVQWACLAVVAYYAPSLPRVAAEVRNG